MHFPRRGQQLLKPLGKNSEPRGAAVPSLEIPANPRDCAPARFEMLGTWDLTGTEHPLCAGLGVGCVM